MKSARISFLLQPYQLARALQTIRQLEPKYKLLSINDMVKTIFHDYLAKMSMNRDDSVSNELLSEILAAMSMTKEVKRTTTIDDLMNLKKPDTSKLTIFKECPKPYNTKTEDLKQHPLPKPEAPLSPATLEEIDRLVKASEFADPNLSDADISSVTDFSPPKDWMK